MTGTVRNAAHTLGLLTAVLAVGACAPSPGEAVAGRIRDSDSPEIGKVVFRPQNWIDPEQIDVFLAPAVSEAEAERLWCDMIVPAGGSEDGENVVIVWNATGTSLMATDPACQPSPS
jgi:hypothetical protein